MASASCFVKTIRSNTLYQYDKDGYRVSSNRNDLLIRNETEKGIFLKDWGDFRSRYGSATTALFISESKDGKTIIKAVFYYGWQQSMILGLLLVAIIYLGVSNQEGLQTVFFGFLFFNAFFALMLIKTFNRQRELIQRVIAHCEEKEQGS